MDELEAEFICTESVEADVEVGGGAMAPAAAELGDEIVAGLGVHDVAVAPPVNGGGASGGDGVIRGVEGDEEDAALPLGGGGDELRGKQGRAGTHTVADEHDICLRILLSEGSNMLSDNVGALLYIHQATGVPMVIGARLCGGNGGQAAGGEFYDTADFIAQATDEHQGKLSLLRSERALGIQIFRCCGGCSKGLLCRESRAAD